MNQKEVTSIRRPPPRRSGGDTFILHLEIEVILANNEISEPRRGALSRRKRRPRYFLSPLIILEGLSSELASL